MDGVIAGMSITDERKQVYDFSDPYFESGVQMAVAKNGQHIKGYEDLKARPWSPRPVPRAKPMPSR